MNHEVKFPREYREEIRKFETSDYGNAEVLNQPLNILVNNDVYIKEQLETVQQGLQNHEKTTAVHVTEAQKNAWTKKAETTAATTSANGLMTAADKAKLDGIAAGAEVNQNAFQTVRAGGVNVQADGKTAQVELVAGNNLTITGDNGTKKITITGPNAVKNPAALAVQLNGSAAVSYDGSAAKTVNITPGGIGAAAAGHTHDDRYYTEAETNNLLNGKANSSHTHTAAQVSGLPATLPANGGNADTVDGAHGHQIQTLDAGGSSHGTAHMVVCQYNVNKDNRFFFRKQGNDHEISVHHALYANNAGNVAWGNVSGKPSTFPPTSHTHDERYYTEAETNNLLNGKANSSHTHAASQISGLPSTLPANGGTAAKLFNSGNPNAAQMIFYWSGQNGQPSWIWGGNDGTNMYVYNPAVFSVNYATTAKNATDHINAGGWHVAIQESAPSAGRLWAW